ncbi:FliM/FliN family flagellar motor switch protein [Novosphingobium sp.]|uniref:FliM/FliN family flagellar motor switch protein n=1 Tax=Novosphingobium sp. TaxID=1874826 RepID=UPI0035B4989D
MKPQRDFVAERAAAQHCAELLRRGPEPAELLPLFAKAGERFARQLAQGLLAVAGGEAPAVECQPVRETTMADLAGTIAPLAANALLGAGIGAAPLLASLQAEAVLRLVDKAFGGKGEAPAVLPEKFPLSARLLIERLEAMVAQRLGQALGSADAIRALRRDGSLADLAPFAPETRLAVLDLDVMEGMRGPWRLTLALPYATLAELFGHGERVPAARPRAPRVADPAKAPFADMPLPLSAVLVDMAMPLHAIATLEPGTVLPVAVARQVPIAIAGTVIARGTVGAQDDCVAIKLTMIA